MDASFLWDSVAFVSYRELPRKAPICKKLLPILHSCIFIWCLRIKTCLKLFLKRWDEENFDCRFIEKNEEGRKAAPALRRVSVPSDLITAVPVGSMTIQSSKADLHPVVENQRMEDTGTFPVSFPLSVFMYHQ